MSLRRKPLSELSLAEKRELLRELLRRNAGRSTSFHPMGYTQQGIWFLYQLAPEMAAYTIGVAAHIYSATDVDALRRAFQTLLDRHPALRSTFSAGDGEPIQHIHQPAPLQFELTDASSLSEEEFERRLVWEAHRPFDLKAGPIFRVTLFRRPGAEHVLFIAVHHIAVDFWSFVVLMEELSRLYPAEAARAAASLPPVAMGYSDFLAWQAEMLAGPQGERLWKYWQRQLAGPLPTLDLPTDRPRPAVQTYAGGSYAFRLDDELTRRLKTLAKAEGATLYMTCLAVFQVLLHRYTGQDDILLASPLAARNRADFEAVVGCITNPVLLRGDLSGDPTFRALLAQTRRTVLEALEHQDFPALLLVERLKPPRDPSRPRLYQVMFNMVRTHREQEALAQFVLGERGFRTNIGGLEFESFHVEYLVAVLDLELTMGEVGGGISAHIVYNSDLFDRSTIVRMERNFQTLLHGIVADPGARIGALPLMPEAERRQTLVEWNDTEAAYPSASCIHELFEAQVKRTPAAVAVALAGRVLTYEELNRRANRLAHALRALGVGPDVPVGLGVGRSPSMAVGLLGILKAGGAYVPLDPALPVERLTFMLEDARVRLLVIEDGLAERIPCPPGVRVLRLDADAAAFRGERTDDPARGASPEDLAYVIYTSGSTGRPKGVLTPHRAVVNHSVAVAERFDLQPTDRVLQFASLSFDAAVEELIPSWSVGAAVVLLPDAVLSALELRHLIERERLTVLDLPTAYWHEWVRELDVARQGLPHSLRLVVVGGERASPDAYATWQRVCEGRVRWINTYGPTETTVTATLWEPPPGGGPQPGSELPIGRPIANTTTYVLDGGGQPVPIGVPGELHIGGAGVARGYLNRPEMTAEKFIPDPFADSPGATLFRTGDLVRYRPDGNLEYLGRTDDQVKVRGFRIEPGEIEATLRLCPGVREALVVPCADAAGEKRLVGYLAGHPSDLPSADQIESFVRAKLPDYMVPSAFVLLGTLPLTPTGKVDRRALPPPDWARVPRRGAFVAPGTPLEDAIARVWAEVLGVDSVGVHDDFFDLGGHSLMAMRLMTRISAAVGVEVPLRVLFEAPTISGLVRRIEAGHHREAGPGRGASPSGELRSPLVAIQARGSRPPLFFVHPVGGSVGCYVELARYLGPDQPFYGLQAPLDGDGEPSPDLAAMATHYAEAILGAQPRGPYFLGGWSFGGVVAIEIARQLEGRGRPPGLVAVLDSWAPRRGGPATPIDEASMVAWFATDLGGPAGKRVRISAEDLRPLGPEERLQRVRQLAIRAHILTPDVDLEQLRRLLRVWTTHSHALLRYEPRECSTHVALIRAKEAAPQPGVDDRSHGADPTLGWGRLIYGPMEIHEAPGDHYTMLARPYVADLARVLGSCLQRRLSAGDVSRGSG